MDNINETADNLVLDEQKKQAQLVWKDIKRFGKKAAPVVGVALVSFVAISIAHSLVTDQPDDDDNIIEGTVITE